MNQKTALAIIVLVVVFVGVYAIFNSKSGNPSGNTSANVSDVPQVISIQGEYVCLPPKGEKKPEALDCTLGVKTDNNVYYAIDAQGENARNVLLSLQTGLKIQIDGTLVPIEQISSDAWQKYDIGGIVITESIKRI